MEWIAVQPYIKVHRGVDGTELVEIEHERQLYLFPDKIISKYHEFPLKKVLDISFRPIGEAGGLLYLHTSGGIYSFTVKTSAEMFIDAYKKLRYNLE